MAGCMWAYNGWVDVSVLCWWVGDYEGVGVSWDLPKSGFLADLELSFVISSGYG